MNEQNPRLDDFDLEYQDATQDVQPPITEEELPDKYKGKSVAEIARMHMNAEKRLSQMGNELGSLRGLTDQVLNLKKEKEKVPTTPVKPVTVDQIFADPDQAIRQTIEATGVTQKVEDAVSRAENLERQLALRDFENRYPTYKQDLTDPAFQEWVTGNPARVELFRRADSYDVASADALWQMWGEAKELKEIKERRAAAAEKRKQAIQAGKTVSDASTESTGKGPTYSRVKLMELQMKAHSGDQKARMKWNDPTFQEELLRAYSEGRVR